MRRAAMHVHMMAAGFGEDAGCGGFALGILAARP